MPVSESSQDMMARAWRPSAKPRIWPGRRTVARQEDVTVSDIKINIAAHLAEHPPHEGEPPALGELPPTDADVLDEGA